MEELLIKILEGQVETNKRLDEMLGDIKGLQGDMNTVKADIKGLQGSVQRLEASVQRIEAHQEETIKGMLSHIKKQDDKRDSQIEVLNKRIFEVETGVNQNQRQ